MSRPSSHGKADKVVATIGALAVISAAACFALGQQTGGIISVLAIFADLTWFGIAF